MKIWLKRIAIGLLAILTLLIVFGPREKAVLEINTIDMGDDLDNYLKEQEARFEDITPDTQKQIIWAGKKGEKTPIAFIYLHGFSATSYEIRPIPQNLAKEFNANLYLGRLSGHGQSGEALANVRTDDYLNDLQEALTIGREIGERVIVISASTGGTLTGIAATDDELSGQFDGSIFISPNFKINNPLAGMITWPLARKWLPLLAGKERNWEPLNEGQERYWTTSYPSVAVFPVAALVKLAQKQDYANAKMPALFYYSPDDQVVDASETDRIVNEWGGEKTVIHPELTEADDPFFHIIAGDIISPAQNDFALEAMAKWVRAHFE